MLVQIFRIFKLNGDFGSRFSGNGVDFGLGWSLKGSELLDPQTCLDQPLDPFWSVLDQFCSILEHLWISSYFSVIFQVPFASLY